MPDEGIVNHKYITVETKRLSMKIKRENIKEKVWGA
jgi:hypothetical protein